MNVLYVVGSCLTRNTSANMSHNGYVQGLLENGCHVDILMAQNSWGQEDAGLPIWEQATYFTYPSTVVQDRLRKKMRGIIMPSASDSRKTEAGDLAADAPGGLDSFRSKLRAKCKKAFYRCFPADPVYPLEHTWLKKASKFYSNKEYDLVISNSSPAASHKLVGLLIKKGSLRCKRWIQIWEDPWYFDLYGGHSNAIRDEEHALLREASEIYYVSPLTLKYQQQHYSDCAHKMKHIPLPYLVFSSEQNPVEDAWSYGYFGDYYSKTRNLVPFYEALQKSGKKGYIYGDADILLKSTEHIEVSGRVTLDRLSKVQDKTRVLVHLCNLHGGQIPGKIYHYSATNKPILFILDGTLEEQELLRAYFSQFDRFYFCENKIETILEAIEIICNDRKAWGCLEAFSPKVVVKQFL